MFVRGQRHRGAVVVAVLAAAYGLMAGLVLAALTWSVLQPAERDAVLDAVADQWAPLLATGLLLAFGLGALVGQVIARYTRALRRLSADLRLLEANPGHQVTPRGPSEVCEVGEGVRTLAERRRVAEHEVETEVAAVAAKLTRERNRLAALMSEIAVAVIVCNADGRVLLYNSAARSLVGDETALGIGRSVYGTLDRSLLDHAVARIRSGHGSSAMATALLADRLLKVRVALVPGADDRSAGFLLLLEDLTERVAAEGERIGLLRQLTETARSSLGTIRAAAETVHDHEDMAAHERSTFIAIVGEEARRLGTTLEQVADTSDSYAAVDYPLADITAADLADLVATAVRDRHGPPVAVRPPPADLWVRAESHGLARGLAKLAEHVGTRAEHGITVDVEPAGRHARVQLTWAGPPLDPTLLRTWAEEPVAGGAVPTLAATVARHAGELWCEGAPEGPSHAVVLLPRAQATEAPAREEPARAGRGVESRPEFYDFDLFERRELTGDWTDVPLAELAYTVFDTETTGLHPTEGDEVVAIGAVRVVNGRLLRQESFERLVDPRRSVPEVSTAVHGLTRDMLRGRPPLEVVLPEFARYAADTVLVGHNVSFDLQFLRLKEEATGVALRQPVLDTLLLDVVADPEAVGHSLEAISSRFGIGVVDRHSALGDALVTAEVLLRLLTLLDRRGIRTLGQALEASRTTLQARLDQRMYRT